MSKHTPLSRRQFVAAALTLPAASLPNLGNYKVGNSEVIFDGLDPSEAHEMALHRRIEEHTQAIEDAAYELFVLDGMDNEFDRVMMGANLIRSEEVTAEDWAWRIDHLMTQINDAANDHARLTGDDTLHHIIASLETLVFNLTDFYKTTKPHKAVAELARAERAAMRAQGGAS